MFRLILLIYEENMKKYVLKFMYNSLRNTMIVNLRKNKLLQQVQKTELIN